MATFGFSSLILALTAVTIVQCVEFAGLKVLKSNTPLHTQQAAVKALIERILPGRSKEFFITINPAIGPEFKDTFVLSSNFSSIQIVGTSGVAAAWGFHHYLKYMCGCQITWGGRQLNVPSPLPKIPTPMIMESNDRFRYYENVCTVSYSFAWHNWTHWQQEIDWMVMNGINLPLAFTGQEAIFRKVYIKLGFNDTDLAAHFGGPAFLAWARMGNMRGWGGPLPLNWMNEQLALQHQILTEMRSFGMIPVLPGFAGHVPNSISRVFPKAHVTRLKDWGRFNRTYCCTYLLDFADPLFNKIGGMFIEELIAEFGTNHIYNADTFNEMRPLSSNLSYIAAAGRSVFEAMTTGDADAVWLMQGWLFLDSGFWKPPVVEALVTAVPQGRMIILDLMSELAPQYTRLSSYFGQPFIWCMLHNFGGSMELYGAFDNINEGPFQGRAFTNSTMIGTGLTPEGIYQNEIMYEFMNENAWRKAPANLTEWVSGWALRRYGKTSPLIDKAWQNLKLGIYNSTHSQEDHGYGTVLTTQPRVNPPIVAEVWYDPETLFTAWDYFVEETESFASSDLFRYDLVDVTRQSLEMLATKLYLDVLVAFKVKNLQLYDVSASYLKGLLADMDTVLASDRHFLLGTWLEAAKAKATTAADRLLYEYNARNQITLWGPRGEINDYASKQWSGLIKDYYAVRWQLFLTELRDCLVDKVPFNETEFRIDVMNLVETPWTLNTNTFPTQPIGDSIAITRVLYIKYRPFMLDAGDFFHNLHKKSQARSHSQLDDIFGKKRPNAVKLKERDDTLYFQSYQNIV